MSHVIGQRGFEHYKGCPCKEKEQDSQVYGSKNKLYVISEGIMSDWP